MPEEQMEEKYNEGNLKEYEHWILTMNFRQTTLGSFVILLKRNNERFSQLTDEEILELKVVMQEMEYALESDESFQPDRYNYMQLGNSLHQLHFHGIPRYATPRTFAGKEWVDTKYGTTPVIPSKTEQVDIDFIHLLRDKLSPYFLVKDTEST